MARRIQPVVQALFRRRGFEEGMAEEMRFHLERYTEDLIGSGLPPAEAARRARMEFGNLDNAKTDCRQARGIQLVDQLGQNLRHAFRLMRRAPGFTATALLTLGLCLGANLSVFAVIDAVLLRPLPFPASDRLVAVYNSYPLAGVPNDGCSLPNYYERRGQVSGFSGFAAYHEGTVIVGESGATERVPVARVTPDFFSTLGLNPVRGRTFTEEETQPANAAVVVLTDAFWRQRLAADPNVLGTRLRINGSPRTVVGVLPPAFSFLSSPARLYVPLASELDERSVPRRHAGTARMVARLRDGVDLRSAQAQIDARNEALAPGDPDTPAMAAAGFRSIVVPLQGDHVSAIRPTLWLVQAGALFLLSIGAVNLVNLLLVRASGRLKELAVRQALGASRRQILSEVLVETTLLTLLGGTLGLGVGAAGIRLLGWLGTDRLPLGTRVAFDLRVALVALSGAVLMGIAIGLPIAWYNLRGYSAEALRSESRGGTAGHAVQRLRHGFLVAQMALSFILLAGAGLLTLSLQKVTALSPGFRPERVLSGQMTLAGKGFPDRAARLAFNQRLLEKLGSQPGVRAAGIATNLPLSGIDNKSAATVDGEPLRAGEPPHGYYSYSVDGDYLAALGLTLRSGRLLDGADSRRPERYCVVDEDFARRNWPGRSALGQRLFEGSQAGNPEEAYTVVGVVAPIKQSGLTEEAGQGAVFYPFGHRPDGEVYVVARTTLDPEALGATLQRLVRELDPEVPVTDIRSMETRISDSLVARRSPALLAAFFSVFAVLLTAIGTYGVVSYAVSQRRREIGLRIALGALPEQVRSQFLGMAFRLLGLAISIGLLGAWASGSAMGSLLFQLPSLNPAILAATTGVLAGVSLVASLLPAQRAAQISPMEAFHEE